MSVTMKIFFLFFILLKYCINSSLGISFDDIKYTEEDLIYNAKGKITFENECSEFEGNDLFCLCLNKIDPTGNDFVEKYDEKYVIDCGGVNIDISTEIYYDYFTCGYICGNKICYTLVSVSFDSDYLYPTGAIVSVIIVALFIICCCSITACFCCYYRKSSKISVDYSPTVKKKVNSNPIVVSPAPQYGVVEGIPLQQTYPIDNNMNQPQYQQPYQQPYIQPYQPYQIPQYQYYNPPMANPYPQQNNIQQPIIPSEVNQPPITNEINQPPIQQGEQTTQNGQSTEVKQSFNNPSHVELPIINQGQIEPIPNRHYLPPIM